MKPLRIVPSDDNVVEMPDSSGAMPTAPATHERSRNLRSVSAVPVSVPIAAGPSERFVKLTRNPDLEPPARFEPTVKGENDVVI